MLKNTTASEMAVRELNIAEMLGGIARAGTALGQNIVATGKAAALIAGTIRDVLK